MPLTLASNAITFTDNTSLSSGIIITDQLSANCVTADKLANNAVVQSFGNNSGPFNFRNKIINGNFDIWQRGNTFNNISLLNVFTADRWQSRTNATGSIVRQPFTLGQTEVPNEPTYYLRYTKTTTTDYATLTQRIEDVRTLAGKRATLSFYARASAPVVTSFRLGQVFGTGGSGFFNWNGTPAQVNVTTTWTRYVVTFDLPSIAGRTIGPNNCLELIFLPGDTNNSWTGFWDIAQVQLEEGTVATPFEQRPMAIEQTLCERYYEKSYAIDIVPGTAGTGSAEPTGATGGYINAILKRFQLVGGFGEYQEFVFKTRKRTKPQMKFYSPSTGAIDRVRDDSAPADRTIANVYYLGDCGVVVNFNVVSVGSGFSFQWTADAEFYGS